MTSDEERAIDRASRDDGNAATTSDAARDSRPLAPLADRAPADGCADVRGWPVDGTDGHALGRVSELLVDTSSRRVTHLELALDEDEEEGEPTAHARVPIEAVRIDDRARRVTIGSITDMGRATG
jgi:sporulation protein YlmC with PRC-barrel domain